LVHGVAMEPSCVSRIAWGCSTSGWGPNKVQLTRHRPGACQVFQPAGGRLGGRSAGRPPEYHRGSRAARSFSGHPLA
jgi:hypothetical protein